MPSSGTAEATRRKEHGIASFRDPSGRLLLFEDRALRLVNRQGASQLEQFLATKVARDFTANGHLVKTKLLEPESDPAQFQHPEVKALFDSDGYQVLVEHERIALQSFPYEWPPEMLYAAGALTLDMADAALAEN